MKVTVFGNSDAGHIRELNEDSFVICGFENGEAQGFCILADGMGGHNAGEVASSMATKIISNELAQSDLHGGENEIVSQITASLDYANNEIYRKSISSRETSGMGTTAVVVYINGSTAYIANIGDSRAYLIDREEMRQITVDHSIVQNLLDSGSITPQEARNHPEKNIITKALGTEPCEDYDIFEFPLRQGDKILLCSDGLTDMLEDSRIIDIIRSNESDEAAVNSLIAAANEDGGKDNITAILISFNGEE